MTNLSIGGDIFRVVVEGDATKPALLLSHSLGADLTLFDAQVPALMKAFRVVRYDSRGHGGSTADGGATSIAMLGRDALGILDALEIDTAHFVGVSMGGAVGQWLLAHAPHRIERAVLANTTAKFGTPAIWNERIAGVLDKGMSAVVDGTIDRWFSPGFIDRVPEKVAAVRAVLEATSPQGYAACCAAVRDLDLRASLHDITAPVLVVSGRDDPSIGEAATRHLVDTIPGAKHVAFDTRHVSNVEADVAFTKAVVGFLTAKLPAKAKRPVGLDGRPAPVRPAPARPATTVSRRVGTRRSTAARIPLATPVKAPPAKVSKPLKREKHVSVTLAATTTKSKSAENRALRLETPVTKTPKAPAARTLATKTGVARTVGGTAAKAKRDALKASPKEVSKKAKLAAPRSPEKVAKRPSAKNLKAMAAAPASKVRAGSKQASAKVSAPAASTKTARGAKSKLAVSIAAKPKAQPAAGKPKIIATKTKSPTGKPPTGKIVAAKSKPTKNTSAPAKRTTITSAKAKTSSPVKAVTIKAPGKTQLKPEVKAGAKIKAKAKPARRAS